MTYLDPAEVYAYSNARRRAADTYQGTLAGLGGQRADLQAQQGLDVAKQTRSWDQMRNRLPGGYARRGLMNSGIYGRGLADYAQNRQASTADLAQRYQSMLNSLSRQEQAAGITYNNAVGDTYDQEAIRRAQVAAALKGL